MNKLFGILQSLCQVPCSLEDVCAVIGLLDQ